MPGLNKFGDKEKRKARRSNHFARASLSAKTIRQQQIPNKKKYWDNEEDYEDAED